MRALDCQSQNVSHVYSPRREPKIVSLDLNKLGGHEFEDLIERLLIKMGFATEGRKPSADGGIDIVAVSSQPLVKGRYIVQCKRYGNSVSSPIIRDLYGVVNAERANKGILITTSSFTSDAIEFARDKPIELIDGNELLSLLEKHALLGTEVPGLSGTQIAIGLLRNEISGLSSKFQGELTNLETHLTLNRSGFGDDARLQAYKRYSEWTITVQDRLGDEARAIKLVVQRLNQFRVSESPDLPEAKQIREQLEELLRDMLSIYSEVRKVIAPSSLPKHQQILTEMVRGLIVDFIDFVRRSEESLEKGTGTVDFKVEFHGTAEMAQAIKEGEKAIQDVKSRTARNHKIYRTGGLFAKDRPYVCTCGFRTTDRKELGEHIKAFRR